MKDKIKADVLIAVAALVIIFWILFLTADKF